MARNFGGQTPAIVRVLEAGRLLQRRSFVKLHQRGVDGFGTKQLEQLPAEISFEIKHWDTLSNLTTMLAALQALQDGETERSAEDNRGTTYTKLIVDGVDLQALQPVWKDGASTYFLHCIIKTTQHIS